MAFNTTVKGKLVAVLPPKAWDMVGDDGLARSGVTRKAIVSLDFGEEPVTLKFGEDRLHLYEELAVHGFGAVIEARGEIKGTGGRQALQVSALSVEEAAGGDEEGARRKGRLTAAG